MKLLRTISYCKEPIAVSVDKIISISPCKIADNELGPSGLYTGNKIRSSGTAINMQDPCPEGTTYIVREDYDTIIKKLEAM